MKILKLLDQKVCAQRMSERWSPIEAKKFRYHLEGLRHSLSIKNSKQTKIHIEFLLEILIELIEA